MRGGQDKVGRDQRAGAHLEPVVAAEVQPTHGGARVIGQGGQGWDRCDQQDRESAKEGQGHGTWLRSDRARLSG
ncbi:hypothetical protein GCM10011324_18520 [Allosediminivita pacifica]|nr:hypothetical protein GCM10011324_18520 [Allosediminivita pacifica]